MSLSAGVRLGPYEIQQAIGAGGMGEVYRARDTRLDRIVAIKVLMSALAADGRFRERFEREARTISQLTHPHICALFDVGDAPGAAGDGTVPFLVMEYLEGETLSARLGRAKTLGIDEALTIAIEIAGALDAAHRAGVIHRDLKPGNIMLTRAGVKLLDFGLAKVDLVAAREAGTADKLTALPTTPISITVQGTLIGTVQYMAPEQLEGADADARTDIFAFGCILYEMLTGGRAFSGKSHAGLITAIMSAQPPPISSVQPLVPLALERMVNTCLAKDPEDRWQSAREMLRELKWITGDAASSGSGVRIAAPVKARRSNAHWRAVAAVLFLTTLAAIGIAGYSYLSRPTLAIVRFTVAPPEKVEFDLSGPLAGTGANGGAVSPDGRKLAFTARDASGKVALWIHSFDSLLAQPLLGTDGADLPFWAPDSRSLGFFAQGKMKRIDVTGGQTLTLSDAPSGRGGAWNRDGVILFAPVASGPLSRVSAAGGQPVAVTRTAPGQTAHRYPSFLADQRHFLFRVSRSSGDAENTFVGSLDSAESTPLFNADTNVVYASPGYVLFARQGTLLAQKFDTARLRLVGEPFPVSDNVATSAATGAGAFSASDSGVLTFRTGSEGADDQQLTWINRSGKTLETIGTASYRGIDLSRDGTRIAVHRHETRGGDIWAVDPKGGTTTRITFDASQHNTSPIWSPDGERIAFGSVRNGSFGLYQKTSNGATRDELLLASTDLVWPTAWSPDGGFIVYTVSDSKNGNDIWLLPLSGDRKPIPFVQTPATDGWGQVSPDGRWLVYASNESGVMQIYVRPFPSGAGKWQISTTHGNWPRWRGDGKEIFYMTGGRQLVAVDVRTSGATFDAGVPKPLFDTRYTSLPHPVTGGGSYHPFSPSADGQRFLVPILVSSASNADATVSAPITVVLNWTAGIRR